MLLGVPRGKLRVGDFDDSDPASSLSMDACDVLASAFRWTRDTLTTTAEIADASEH